MTACPCGKADARSKPVAYESSCGRYIAAGHDAPDAQTLMRSRYAAFVMCHEAYLLSTWHPTTRPAQAAPDPATKWLGLEVRSHSQMDDTHAQVEFVARYRTGGKGDRLHERSRFVNEEGRWYYVDGELL